MTLADPNEYPADYSAEKADKLPPLLSIRQACEIGLPFSPAVAYAAIRAHEFPIDVIRVGRKRLYLRKTDVLALLGLDGGGK